MAFERAAYLEAIIGADITQFRKAMRDIRNDLGVLSETTASKLGAIGRTATFTITTPLVAAGTAAIQYASTFENSMRNVNSMAQLNEQDYQNMSAAVLEWGSSTVFGATKASEALYTIISAGYTDMPKAMEVMQNSTKLAEATQADLTGTTEALTAVMLSYGDSNMTAAHAADVMARITQMGVGEQDDYNRTMQKTLPLANALGIAYDDLGAVQAVVSQNGSGLDKAGTSTAMMLSNLLKPTAAMEAEFHKLGVTTGSELIQKFGGLTEAVAALRADTSEIDFAKMFSKTGLEAAYTLTNDLDQTNKKLAEFKDGIDGAVNSSRAQQMKSFAFQFDLFKSSLEGAAITIGQTLLPVVNPMIQSFTEFFTRLREANPEVIKLGVGAAAVAAAVGPLLWIFSSLLNPFGLLVTAVVTLATAFETDFAGIATSVKDTIHSVFGDLDGLSGAISDFMNTVTGADQPQGGIDLSWLIPDQAAIDAAVNAAGPATLNADQVVTVQDGDSLWSIWANDFADNMTWTEFKKATGWTTGMVIHPGDILTIKGTFSSVTTTSGWHIPTASEVTTALLGSQPVQIAVGAIANAPTVEDWTNLLFPQESIISRLTRAISEFAPKFLAGLGSLITTGAKWADAQLGKGINWLAGLFQPGNGSGDSPVYTAFKDLLNGDLFKAIDDIVPGLGTKLGTMVSDAVSQISSDAGKSQAITAISNLIGHMKTWLETEAVPTLARGIGFAIGRAGAAVASGVQQLAASITSGQAASTVNTALNDAGQAVGQPFMDGFGEGLQAGGVKDASPFEVLAMGIAGSVALAFGAATVVSVMSNGIIGGLSSAFGTVMSWAGWAVWGAMLPIRMAAATAVSTAWTYLTSAVSAGINWALAGIGGLIKIGLTWAVGMIGTGLATIAAGASWLWTGFVAIVGAGLSTAFGALTAATGWIVAGVSSLMGALAGAIALAPVVIGFGVGLALNAIVPESWKAALRDGWKNGIDSVFGEGTAEAQDVGFQQTVQDIAKTAINALTGKDMATQWNQAGNDAGSNVADGVADGFADGTKLDMATLWGDNPVVPAESVDQVADAFNTGLTTAITNGAADRGKDSAFDAATIALLGKISPSKEQADAAMQPVKDGWDNTINMLVAKVGTMDPQQIDTQFLGPLRTNFETTFGDGSVTKTTFISFFDMLATRLADTGTNFANLAKSGADMSNAMNITIVTMQDVWVERLDIIREAVKKLTDQYDALRVSSGNPVTLKVGVQYSTGVAPAGVNTGLEAPAADTGIDGSHAGGLGRVPFDGYIAELHQDERVLTATQADAMDNMQVSGTGEIIQPQTTNDNRTQIVSIYGINDVDKMLRELDRRGIKLNGKR